MSSEVFQMPKALGTTYLTHAEHQLWYTQSIEQPEEFWSARALEMLDWSTPFSEVLDFDYSKAHIRWFGGGKINVSFNCLDRHLEARADKIAILWEGNEPGETRKLTYRQLWHEVQRCANVLLGLGVRQGDRVAIYMPMVPEAAISMLACARIGAIHSVVFAGFSADSLRDRIVDAQTKVVITANVALRGAKTIALKSIVDQAVDNLEFVEKVVVFQRTDTETAMKPGRDLFWHELLANANEECEAVALDSEAPLFILYTSGSTGKPKGVLHTQAGYLLYAAITHRYVFDYREEDIYFCAADIGWVTGHSYVVYGPLANGATSLMFESVPNYPDAGRYWDIIQRHKVSIFYTAPTAIRAVAKEGPELPHKYDLSSLRILGSVGEPINRDAWIWYFEKVGSSNCALVDTWWQTETGGILIAPLPGIGTLKPSSASRPFFGIRPSIVDERGSALEGSPAQGHLCIDFPWPGQMRTVYGDHQRFFATYFSQYPGKYFTGDGCKRDHEGDYFITGRVDDVLNISGHRIGTAEVESAIVQSGIVAEAAVVGMPHDIKGQVIYAFCIARDGCDTSELGQKLVRESVRRVIGAFASPEKVRFVPGLPKTRSGKIMRRILRKIAEGEHTDFGDTSSLADPTVVSQIVNACG